MNFSYNWLRELVEGLDSSPSELMSLITIKTAECEGVHEFAPFLANVCAARIESVEKIEGSKNVKAVVDTGRYGHKTVVCGAANCREGIVTAYVPAGTTLPGAKEIRKASIGGVESDGMLAAADELGVSRDHSGILELTGIEPGEGIGVPSDFIIEVDNKSLTHRPDLWGHHGMAREVAAITHRALKDPVDPGAVPQGSGAIAVRIEDYDLCPRYSALVLENVTVGPSPLWLQARLEAVGLNAINNVVDVTNYVMAEIAQPMHAFDADKLHGGIIVRRAAAGERMVALNNEEYELQSTNLVIADEESAIAVAGVIGGLYSSINGGTTRIVLESANFHPGSVRKTSANLKLRTDASMRFEKSLDPENTVRGLARAVQLLQIVSPGIRIAGGIVDARRPAAPPREPIVLPLEWLDRKIGRHVDPAEVRQILESLQFGVRETTPGVLSVTVPSWRATKDVSIKDDLVEEIGRMIGYASIPPQPPLVPTTVPPSNAARRYHHELRGALAAMGFDEVYNYSFVNEKTIERFGLDVDEHVRVLNPIASDQTHLRTALIPGIQKNVEENARYFDNFRIFEIGVEIRKQDDSTKLPNESFHLCAANYVREGNAEGLFELKSLAEALVPGIATSPSSEPAVYEHPARVADMLFEGQHIGRLFELHPAFCERGRASILDLDLDAVMRLRSPAAKYTPLRRFPSSSFDLSVVAASRALSGEIEALLRQYAGSELESIEWVREYAGPPLADGTKSVSYRLTVGLPDRTLSSDDLTAIRQRIIGGMQKSGYELRV